MGYGMGWITKAALILDELDDAGPLLANIAKYSYDKNMDYVDPQRGIDWRKFLWLIPEGTNLLPDGRLYRIGDLTNKVFYCCWQRSSSTAQPRLAPNRSSLSRHPSRA